jgi:hypothetical protein
LGLIASYARPGGNVTGILSQVEGLPGKNVEIARELFPRSAVIGVLVNPLMRPIRISGKKSKPLRQTAESRSSALKRDRKPI